MKRKDISQNKEQSSELSVDKTCSPISMHKDIKGLVDVQVDINRAVWAANLTKPTEHGACTCENGRDQYIESCIRSALSTLNKLI